MTVTKHPVGQNTEEPFPAGWCVDLSVLSEPVVSWLIHCTRHTADTHEAHGEVPTGESLQTGLCVDLFPGVVS